jgi:hypothetical protein
MTLFEWFKDCTIEEMAEWLYEFQHQSEKNIFDDLRKSDIDFTTIQLDCKLRITDLIKSLNKDLDSWENELLNDGGI